ncbi:hypothetical protein J0H58_28720 [bacterium]|nr:hypothetical protein [bacterium]
MFRRTAALVGLLALAGEGAAQPIAPPRRPTFNSYSSLFTPGSGYFGYGYGGSGFGFNPYGFGAGGAQQALVLQQLNQTNQAVANLQQFLAYGVNPVLAPTGRGATFNNLGHWYPTYRGQGVAFGGAGGGFGGGFAPPTQGLGATGMMGAAMTGAATVNAFGGGGGGMAAPRTSGSGIPVGQPRR